MHEADHLHPRYLRAYVNGWVPNEWKPLHRTPRPLPASLSGKRRDFTYKGMRARLDRGERRCDQLKRQRQAWGLSRHELDAYLAKLASATCAGDMEQLRG